MPTIQGEVAVGQILVAAEIEYEGQREGYMALLDTGSQVTLISPRVVNQMGLKAIGHTSLTPASGELIITPKYRATLAVPVGSGSTVFPSGRELEVSELPFQPDNFDILLGMDFLEVFHFTMYGRTFILSN